MLDEYTAILTFSLLAYTFMNLWNYHSSWAVTLIFPKFIYLQI